MPDHADTGAATLEHEAGRAGACPPAEGAARQCGVRVVATRTTLAAREEADRDARDAARRGGRVTRLETDARAATLAKQRLATAGGVPLGVQITTLAAWVRDRWALYGDGRALVTASQRRALVLQALDATPVRCIDAGAPGTVRAVEGALRTYAGTSALGQAPGGPADALVHVNPSDMEPSQRDIFDVCRAYRRLLSRHGLIEQGEVATCLPALMGEVGWSHLTLDGISELSQAQAALVVECARHAGATVALRADVPGRGDSNPAFGLSRPLVRLLLDVSERMGVPCEVVASRSEADPWRSGEVGGFARALFRPSPEGVVTSTGDVRFCLPAGGYAEPQAIVDEVAGALGRGMSPRDVIVACRNPIEMAEELRGRLSQLGAGGVGCEASGALPVKDTAAGRALTGLVTLVTAALDGRGAPAGGQARPALRPVASDLAINPLLEIDPAAAMRLDASWRLHREAGAQDFLDGLARRSERAADAVRLLELGDVAGAARAVTGTGDDDADDAAEGADATQARVAGVLVNRLEQAQELGCDALADYGRLVDGLTANAALLTVPPGSLQAQLDANVLAGNPNAVRVMGLADTEGERARAVIVCDLNASGAVDPVDPLGGMELISNLDRQRWRYSAAVEAASELLVLERRLSDEDANPLRPSSLFEESVACFRADVSDVDGLDGLTGLPKPPDADRGEGAPGAAREQELPFRTVGEEGVPTIVSPVGDALLDRATFAVRPVELCLREQWSKDALVDPDRPLSPSSLEEYLRCPARWFYDRRLPNDPLDAELGPREIGTFSHAVLQGFYERMPERLGVRRVTSALLSDAVACREVRELLDECFDSALRECSSGDRRAGDRLMPVDATERRRIESLRRPLLRRVEHDAALPDGFAPRLLEWSFGFDDGGMDAIPYAGALLRGTIDRVDANASGDAVVIDYKGNLERGHHMPPVDEKRDAPLLPLHSQVLMYATALERSGTGLRPLGALYLSYKEPEAAGFVGKELSGLADAGVLRQSDVICGLIPQPPCPEDPDAGGEAGGAPRDIEGFPGILAYAEREASVAVGRLFEGCISPLPRFGKDSCDRCPVTNCPERIA